MEVAQVAKASCSFLDDELILAEGVQPLQHAAVASHQTTDGSAAG
jgi:hypothetical protein